MKPTITIPADEFALLWAYCFLSQTKVPAHVKSHPDYPGNRNHKRGHLTGVLEPYALRAMATLVDPKDAAAWEAARSAALSPAQPEPPSGSRLGGGPEG